MLWFERQEECHAALLLRGVHDVAATKRYENINPTQYSHRVLKSLPEAHSSGADSGI